MQIVKFGQKLNTPIVIALGFFGCMHKGHVQLLDEAKKLANSTNSKVALFTFSNNHLKVLGKDVKQLYTFDERCKIYQNLGVDVLVCAEFNRQFMQTSGAEFLNELNSYDLKGVVCGFDYTCGSDRKNSQFVSEYLGDIPVKVVEAVCVDDVKISTTLIRAKLGECQISLCNQLLSQTFFFDGKVVHGRGVGNQLGFPTANVQVDADKFLPVGVFAGNTVIDGVEYKCIINIGAKPTYDIDEPTVEAHIINYVGDLYGRDISVKLRKFLRPICKFDCSQQLVQQLKLDMENCLDD